MASKSGRTRSCCMPLPGRRTGRRISPLFGMECTLVDLPVRWRRHCRWHRSYPDYSPAFLAVTLCRQRRWRSGRFRDCLPRLAPNLSAMSPGARLALDGPDLARPSGDGRAGPRRRGGAFHAAPGRRSTRRRQRLNVARCPTGLRSTRSCARHPQGCSGWSSHYAVRRPGGARPVRTIS